jgi:hypothetical protein
MHKHRHRRAFPQFPPHVTSHIVFSPEALTPFRLNAKPLFIAPLISEEAVTRRQRTLKRLLEVGLPVQRSTKSSLMLFRALRASPLAMLLIRTQTQLMHTHTGVWPTPRLGLDHRFYVELPTSYLERSSTCYPGTWKRSSRSAGALQI